MDRSAGETARAVLDRLRTSHREVSGGLLSQEIGVSRMAISKAVAQLRLRGYEIASAPHRGYHLIRTTDQPIATEVQPLLSTRSLGRAWVYERELASTNRTAAERAAAGGPHGLVVSADTQTEGRGRLGRAWHSPAGLNLYVSIVLRPEVAVVRVPQVSLVVALALRRSLIKVCPHLPVAVKWPNDLWVGSRKLAGILCEMAAEMDRIHHVIVGVGLNVNLQATDWPADLAERATSLRLETGAMQSRPQVLAAFLNALEPALDVWLAADDLRPFLDELAGCSVLVGRRIRVDLGVRTISGVARGISADGRLRLETAPGTEALISSGEAHILPA